MTDSIIERHAIRAALALAAASVHGQVADAIADLRDEATQIIGLCVHNDGSPDNMRQWCDTASALVERLSSDGTLPRHPALAAAAAILRLRLALAQKPTPTRRPSDTPARPATKKVASQPVTVGGNQKVVREFIAGHPDVRTKSIIDSLNGSLSPRSVKRCLKELCDVGIVRRKRQDDGSVTYRVDSPA